jgi:hypothetical protein
VTPDRLIFQQRLSGMKVPPQDLLVGDQVVNPVVAVAADPEPARAHLLLGEAFEEAGLAMAMPRNQVMKRERLPCALAEFTGSVPTELMIV